MNCYENITTSEIWERNIDYVMFVDENNSPSSINNIKKKIFNMQEIDINENIFTVTGCIFKKENYRIAKEKFEYLRNKYWEDGCWINKKNQKEKVCFHTEDIKGRKKAFAIFKNDDDLFNQFVIDLDEILDSLNYKVVSININFKDYIQKSSYNEGNVYKIAFNFIIERLIYSTPSFSKCTIIFEARGKKEDKDLLEHINYIINTTGTEYIKSDELKRKILGVYFNKKFNKKKHPYTGLQIADLSSYPIHRYIKFNNKGKDFLTIEKKLLDYPNYSGRGIKVYPKK